MSSYSLPLLTACDHAGLALKRDLMRLRQNFNWRDMACLEESRSDYPDWADKLCQALQKGMFGLLICGTGQGMCMRANQWRNIRAALCHNKEIAGLARAHNNANVLCLSGRFLCPVRALGILDVFLSVGFDSQPAYKRRLKKLCRPPSPNLPF